jgi:hypothetical protein
MDRLRISLSPWPRRGGWTSGGQYDERTSTTSTALALCDFDFISLTLRVIHSPLSQNVGGGRRNSRLIDGVVLAAERRKTLDRYGAV